LTFSSDLKRQLHVSSVKHFDVLLVKINNRSKDNSIDGDRDIRYRSENNVEKHYDPKTVLII